MSVTHQRTELSVMTAITRYSGTEINRDIYVCDTPENRTISNNGYYKIEWN